MDLFRTQILVLGAGVSGISAARLARKHGADVVLLDQGKNEHLTQVANDLKKDGIDCRFGDCPAPNQIPVPDLIIFSPGIANDSPLGQLAACFPMAVQMSELGFGACFLDCKMIAVTGTNGKTTTVELLKHCLNRCGIKAEAGGNIGLPLSKIAMDFKPGDFDVIIAEVSSFQLEHPRGFSPDIAILLNITPDHLVRHGTMEEYTRLKYSLFDCLNAGGTACIEYKLAGNLPNRENGKFTVKTFDVENNQADYRVIDEKLAGCIPIKSLKLRGAHNFENCLAVISACQALGISADQLADPMSDFSPDDHRLQEIGTYNGIRFIDDSKATNVDALHQALMTIGHDIEPPERKIVLIAGGIDKSCDLSSVKNDLMIYVKCVFAIGLCRERLNQIWSDVVEVIQCDSLESAVDGAKSCALPGDIIMLSPGCASQDMFRDYAERGNKFAQLAQK